MWQQSMPRAAVAALLFATLAVEVGCSGQASLREASAASCAENPPPARVRRLSRGEFENSASATLGFPVSAASLPSDNIVMGYSNHEGLQVSDTFASSLDELAETTAASAVANLSSLVSCPSGQAEAACVRNFVSSFGKKAFRRPLSAGEVEDLYTLFVAGKDGSDFKSGIELVVQGILQSPQFLYRTEIGESSASTVVELTQYEIASQLAYVITGAPPDEELMAAADAGSLSDAAERERQARRLLKNDPKARAQLKAFIAQWLGITNAGSLQKDSSIFPAFSNELKGSLLAETNAFSEYVMFDGDHRLSTLLDADFTFANASLGSLYGVSGISGTELQRVALNATQRRGLLNHASFLANYAHANESAPILRGKAVWMKVLCKELDPPPPGVNVNPPPVTASTTTRERFTAHVSNPMCATCHKIIDPIGYGMEDFDGIGAHRTTDNGRPVDARGSLQYVQDEVGDFTGGAQLSSKLARSAEVSECFNTQLFRYLSGRKEQAADACSLETTRLALVGSDLDIHEQLVALVKSGSFTHRQKGQ